jgi:hypothetical protein
MVFRQWVVLLLVFMCLVLVLIFMCLVLVLVLMCMLVIVVLVLMCLFLGCRLVSVVCLVVALLEELATQTVLLFGLTMQWCVWSELVVVQGGIQADFMGCVGV